MGSRYPALFDERFFEFVMWREVQVATRLRYPLSFLVLLPEAVEGASELDSTDELVDQVANVIGPVVRAIDLLVRGSNARTLNVLLVDAPLDTLAGIIQRMVDKVSGHRFRINDNRKTVSLSIGGACFPATADSVAELVSRAEALATEARNDSASWPRYRLR
jgi:GGDEF domain-containing protein